MNALDSKALSSQLLSNMKAVNLNSLLDKLISFLKRSEKVAKAPADMEVDNLDWYRTFPIKK